MKRVPVIVWDCTDEEAVSYALADNQHTMNSPWDEELLAQALQEVPDVDPEAMGFDPDYVAALLELDFSIAGLVDEDHIPTDVERRVNPGDLFELGDHRLFCGDATKEESYERLLEGKMAGMCVTDPPWNVAIGQDSNPRHRQRAGLENDDLSPSDFLQFLRDFSHHLVHYVRGDLYCVLGAKEWPNLDLALRDAGYHWSATIIWVKDEFVLGRSKYHRRYEPLWYGWPQKRKSSYSADRKQDDVWEIPRPRVSEEHPTMKPVALFSKAIENSSKHAHIVLDPFGGSGTTMIACETLHRHCRMMELDPKYCDVIIKRWEDFTGKEAKPI